ncbi:hypothetical protein GIB67_000948 [Kingdonia uniflora]|uniref:Homeobox-leucine zipper protein n=1 Tax=Kingdonia uniflora TaxID=39325 RepID=A0A7J7MFN3_9MAGN|nr:hypothetical protein GIB67_000948 [Kingdonia uniflora]
MNKKKSKKMFSDEQIRKMVSIFGSESKLKPRRKLQIAKELGLQPKQVAIWFQNKRARWKSQQLEQDYDILKASYGHLQARFECLKKEKQSLTIEKLADLMGKPREGRRCHTFNSTGDRIEGNSVNGDAKSEFDQKPNLLLEGPKVTAKKGSNDENIKKNFGYFVEEEKLELLSMPESVDGGLASSPDNWCNFDSYLFDDHSCNSSQWWEFCS